ncbi:hypothetical protein PS619_02018 [Pseudomonas fluorescens]|nr:hypothetical protein PS619_02018 [Pseudomonas fluorescens]
MPNLSPLLYSTNDHPTFLDALDLTVDEKKVIDSARREIREALRDGLPEALEIKGYEGKLRSPKFFIQGSWAYKTLNRPCQTPPQQSDVDDGVYLPMSIVKEENRPSLAIKDFFDAVIEVLEPIRSKYRWKIFSKSTCVRVEISQYAHIDLPLYAIPDEQYLLLKASLEARGYIMGLESLVANSATDSWKKLPSDKILLACEDGWITSDPLKMKEWFEKEVSDSEEQLRRVIRYIKAFRDNQWEKGGPSSILLMAAACPLYKHHYKRDDLALLHVLQHLPLTLRNGVKSPVDSSVDLTDPLGDTGVEDAAQKFETFRDHLKAAVENTADKHMACIWMQRMLGERFPNRPDLLVVESPDTMPAAMAAVAPERGPSEIIKRSKSG